MHVVFIASSHVHVYVYVCRAKRKRIRETFSKLDRKHQKNMLRGLIDLHAVSFKGRGLELNRKRKQRLFTAVYHLKPSARRVRVCLKAFVAVLGIHTFKHICLPMFHLSSPYSLTLHDLPTTYQNVGIGTKQIRNLNHWVWQNPKSRLLAPADGRGRHHSRPNRIPFEIVVCMYMCTYVSCEWMYA
jgi:hypothetical protein